MKNDTLPATDYLKVFNREQEPDPVPPRHHPVTLPTVVIFVKGGAVQQVCSSWPCRVIVADGDDADNGPTAETEALGNVQVIPVNVETDKAAQRIVAEIEYFADREDTLPLPEGSALSQ